MGPPKAQGQQNPQGQLKKSGQQKLPQFGAPKLKITHCVRSTIAHTLASACVVTYALPGATHSFIFETFVKRLKFIPEDLDLGFKFSIPSGDQMVSTSIVRNLELRLQKDVVRADLIVLPILEFDIILGMDWLGASIDFQKRSVFIRPSSGKSFVFEAARNKQMLHTISCFCARKLIKRGYQAFLACIISASVLDSQKLEDVEVVKDFPNAFHEDVYGILPDREMEFSIELMLGTMSISKTRYRLAPAEMKEMKDQILEFLDNTS
ncbi:uncharacterized protein LOC142525831 [Primulina tabacum]|uniref:uncharacterized protein LOC142525831 n=1 Tax=Primulina tabacum TaxID=48773 RepID=UPI003F597054